MTFLRIAVWLLAVLAGIVAISLATGCKTTNTVGADPSQVVVEYRRTGGVAGLNDHLLVFGNRKATITGKTGERKTEIDPNTFKQIVQQLEQAEFSKLDKEYLPANPCCDLFEYVIAYKGYTVRTKDTAVPDKLQPILKSLNQVIDGK